MICKASETSAAATDGDDDDEAGGDVEGPRQMRV